MMGTKERSFAPLRVGNPRLYDHAYQDPQLSLWEPGEVEWHVSIHVAPYGPRPKRKGRAIVIQFPLFLHGDGTQGEVHFGDSTV